MPSGPNPKTVFVGMSGGVDSSVAALLLKKKGYDVVGVFMRCYNVDGCAERDAEDARRVAEHIGIPFYVWDFEEEYKKRVVDYMIDGYRAGITPNPDVMCNREIKFGLFLKKALAAGADYVATGHYVALRTAKKGGARKESVRGKRANSAGVWHPSAPLSLFEAKDKNKDQSYFLWTLTQQELGRCLFPIGDYLKPRVRAIAAKAGLPTAAKKDSQGICFLGNVDIEEFLRTRIPAKQGELVTTSGEAIGTHHGAAFYTVGQRHINADFKFPKTGNKSDRRPFYVVSKDVKRNIVVLAEGGEHPALYRKEAMIANANWLNGQVRTTKSHMTEGKMKILVRVRYRQPLVPAALLFGRRSLSRPSRLRLVFDRPQKFVAEGQSAVFYAASGEMLGGGIII